MMCHKTRPTVPLALPLGKHRLHTPEALIGPMLDHTHVAVT